MMRESLVAVLAALLLLVVAAGAASAAPLVKLEAPDDVTVEANSTFSVDVVAENTGSTDADTQVLVDDGSLPEGFTVVHEPGQKRIWPTQSATFTLTLGVGHVDPVDYEVTLYDLTRSDPKSYVNFTVTVEAEPTPTETATETATATGTETATETATATGTETEGPMGNPGPGALVAALCLALAARFR